MLSAENGPEELVAWVAVSPDRVASVDCGVMVCVVQDVPMLRETGVLATQVRLVLDHCLLSVPNPLTVVELEKANAVEPTQKFKAFRPEPGAGFNRNLMLPEENNWIAFTV